MASLTMIPVVWSFSPASAFFSSTVTFKPARASALAQARPAKLAPTTAQSIAFVIASCTALLRGTGRRAAAGRGPSARNRRSEADRDADVGDREVPAFFPGVIDLLPRLPPV